MLNMTYEVSGELVLEFFSLFLFFPRVSFSFWSAGDFLTMFKQLLQKVVNVEQFCC